jgi:N6-adenosine-specific RNA methylase IME4
MRKKGKVGAKAKRPAVKRVKKPVRKAARRSRAHYSLMGPTSGMAGPLEVRKGEDLKAAAARTLGLGQPTRRLDEIKIGKRHRKDFGDLKSLARSIDDRGSLLQPIVINKNDKLIAGERRLRAWPLTRFGKSKKPIPVHVVDVDSIVAGEWDENAQRKDFTPSEAVAIKREIEALLKRSAKERQRIHGGTAPGRKAAKAEAKGRAADHAARYVGKDRKTIVKAEEIVDAAEKNPTLFGKLKSDMDRTGRVDGPHKRLQVMRQAAEIRKEPPPLPGKGPYRGGIIDPPWPSEPAEFGEDAQAAAEDASRRQARGYYPYPTMSIDEIAALDVPSILHEDGVVGLWITNFHLVRGHHVPILKRWGLLAVTLRTWVKDRIGRGQVLRGQTEHMIIAIRGKPTIEVGGLSTFFHAAIGKEHSEKPQKSYDDFEKLVAAPRYFELFARRKPPENWDGHGDQVGKLVRDPNITEAISTFFSSSEGREDEKTDPELFALETIERGGDFLIPDDMVKHLTIRQLIKGEKKKQITQLGRARLATLRGIRTKKARGSAATPLPDAPPQGGREKERACRVCGSTEEAACPGGCAWSVEDGGLCTACEPALHHVVSMQGGPVIDAKTGETLGGESVAICSCGKFESRMKWGGHADAQDKAVRLHWQDVVALAGGVPPALRRRGAGKKHKAGAAA